MSEAYLASSPVNESRHKCTEAMKRLFLAISGENNIKPLQDLVIVLGQALSIGAGNGAGGCPFCPLAPEIVWIADRIHTNYENMMNDRAFLWSIYQLQAISEGFMESLLSDCRALQALLQSIVNGAQNESKTVPSSPNASLLDRAQNLRIEGGNIVNVAGSSNSITFIKQEWGTGIRSVLMLLLLGFLLFRLA